MLNDSLEPLYCFTSLSPSPSPSFFSSLSPFPPPPPLPLSLFLLLSPSSLSFSLTVGQDPLWLHLRCWSPGMSQYVYCTQSDESKWSVSSLCDEYTWVLPAAHGPTVSLFTPHNTAVSSIRYTHGSETR